MNMTTKFQQKHHAGFSVPSSFMGFLCGLMIVTALGGKFGHGLFSAAPVPSVVNLDVQLLDRAVHTACPVVATWDFAAPLPTTSHPMLTAIDAAAKRYAVEHELVVAVMATESNCQMGLRSRKGARGPMQLMPATARWLGVKNVDHVEDNIMGGTKYLAMLLKEFNGDTTKAIAAYNSGPTAVRKSGGVPPIRETKRYVERVMGYYRNLQKSAQLKRA